MEFILLIAATLVALFLLARRFEGRSGLRKYSPEKAQALLLAYHDRFRQAPPGPMTSPEFLNPDKLLDAVAEALRTGHAITSPELRNLDARVDAGTAERVRDMLRRARELEQQAEELRVQARQLIRAAGPA